MILKEHEREDNFLIVTNIGTREDDWGDTYYYLSLLKCDKNLNPIETEPWEWCDADDITYLYGTVNFTYNLENIVWHI